MCPKIIYARSNAQIARRSFALVKFCFASPGKKPTRKNAQPCQKQTMDNPEQFHKSAVAAVECVICREFYGERTPCHVHHIAEGSGIRSDFMVAGLCLEHHLGAGGFHKNPKGFLRRYKLPTEYHLMLLVNKYRAIDGR